MHVYTGIIQDVTFLIKVLDFQNFLLPVSASILRRFDRRMHTNLLDADYNIYYIYIYRKHGRVVNENNSPSPYLSGRRKLSRDTLTKEIISYSML